MNFLKKRIEFFLFSIILIVSGCSWASKDEKKQASLLVINVLDKDLYDDAHIKGSINVPFDEIEEYAKKLDKNTHIVVYCSNYMCTASGASAKMLKEQGFNNVWAYEAGMAEWFEQNKDLVEGPAKQAYLTMKFEMPQSNTDESVKHITTQELRKKIKEMLNIPGY